MKTSDDPTAAARPGRRPWEQLDEIEEYREACRIRLEHVVHVREPLVLISQIQRSGGTLLSRLFDGHPECHAHPYELKVGSKRGDYWPELDLAAPDTWFNTLYEQKVAMHFAAGYSKPGLKSSDVEVFPFVFLSRLQKLLFDACVAAREIERERDVYDCYFTSYFNAWLDNQNLFSGPKRIVTAFMPSMNLDAESTARFFAAYPDGTMVSLVREPRAWFGSASRHRSRYEDLDTALGLWRRSTEAAIECCRRFGERAIVLTYEELVVEPEGTMRRLAERLGISMAPELLMPTFNGRAVLPNSSDSVPRYGIVSERADAYRDVLEPAVIARIDELAGDLYEQVHDESRAQAAEL